MKEMDGAIKAAIKAEIGAGRAAGMIEGDAENVLSVRVWGREYFFEVRVPADRALQHEAAKAVSGALKNGLTDRIAWGQDIQCQIRDHSRTLRERGMDEAMPGWQYCD